MADTQGTKNTSRQMASSKTNPPPAGTPAKGQGKKTRTPAKKK